VRSFSPPSQFGNYRWHESLVTSITTQPQLLDTRLNSIRQFSQVKRHQRSHSRLGCEVLMLILMRKQAP